MEKKSNKLIAIRKILKSKKPSFLRQDGHKKVRLGRKWRKPKGLQNKMRLHKRGYRRSVSVGYKSPRKVRGLGHFGLKIAYVCNADDMKNVGKGEGIIISATTSTKKRLEIIKIAQSEGIPILNIRDAAGYVKRVEDRIKKKKEEKEKLEKDRKKKEAKQKKEAEDKKKKKQEKQEEKEKETKAEKGIERIAEEETKKAETKKEAEKKEKDRILTKKV